MRTWSACERYLVAVVVLLLAAAPRSGTIQTARAQGTACENGRAAGFPCSNVALLAHLSLEDLGDVAMVNDLWGWTDPETGREYALVGLDNGVAFVDVTDPAAPVYLGVLPLTQGAQFSLWRDVKVYQSHAYVVADQAGEHGMQVFDLTQLRDVTDPPVTFEQTALYDRFGSAHNVAINTDTGFAYAVGTSGQEQPPGCGAGLHIVDIRDPARPAFAGCFVDEQTGLSAPGYVHDAQCVVYQGPDADYQGREICFTASETAVGIMDVTDKDDPVVIARASYPNFGYVHQGWLTEDHRYFFQNDELDEASQLVENTRTLIWDLTDLDEPALLSEYFGPTESSDHNLYVVGDVVYEANYRSGLRILDATDVANPVEVAFFDTVPSTDRPGFSSGAWSVYPFLPSGTLLVSSIREGLFMLDASDLNVAGEGSGDVPETFSLSPAYPNPFNPATTVTVALPSRQHVTVAAYDVLGRRVATLHQGPLPAGTHRLTFDAAGLPSGTYVVHARTATTRQIRTVTLVK